MGLPDFSLSLPTMMDCFLSKNKSNNQTHTAYSFNLITKRITCVSKNRCNIFIVRRNEIGVSVGNNVNSTTKIKATKIVL